jgi:hypothetical protein
MQTQSRFGAMGARSLVLTLALTIPAVAAGQPAPQLDSPSQATTVTDTRATAAPIRNWTPTFPQLFSGLGNDFRQLTANNGFLIIGIGGGAAFGAHTFDRSIAASGFGGSTMRDVFGPGQIVGGVLVQSGAAFATYFTGRMTGSPRLARVGAELVRAQIVAQGVTQTIKFGAPRTRPDGTAFSFPSGHTASSFATGHRAAARIRVESGNSGLRRSGVGRSVAHPGRTPLPERRHRGRNRRHPCRPLGDRRPRRQPVFAGADHGAGRNRLQRWPREEIGLHVLLTATR